MYSLNVPVPGRVARLAADLHPHLATFDRVREQHSLVCKRLGDPAPEEYPVVQGRVRRALAGMGPFAARIDGIDYFPDPPAGPGPVVYLSVESPGLVAVHERLCEAFELAADIEGEVIAGIEGEDYVPHVTLARGGTREDARSLAEQPVEPVEWTVNELVFWDRAHGGEAGRVRLPA